MKIIRFVLGKLILFGDWITSPSPKKRDAETQQLVNEAFEDHALYEFRACPFCVKVRRFMKKENIQIPTRDAKTEPFRTELLQGGGRVKVPCLRIQRGEETTWLYESNDIINYIDERIPQP